MPVRIFLTKRFAKNSADEGIEIDSLINLVQDIETETNQGKWRDLGGGVFKASVAREGEGVSGGFRVIIMIRRGDKAFFVQVFSKKDKANLSETELKFHKERAREWLNWNSDEIEIQLATNKMKEIKDGGEKKI